MATEYTEKSRTLLDTKYGTLSGLEEKTSKTGKTYLTATLTTLSGKEVTVYAHGPKTMETLREKATSGEPTFVMGELIAKGGGISASKFEPVTYTGKIVEISKEGTTESGPWAYVKMQIEGRDKPMGILATGEDVARVKNAGNEAITMEVAWTAGKNGDNWLSSPRSAAGMTVVLEPKLPEPEEPEGPDDMEPAF